MVPPDWLSLPPFSNGYLDLVKTFRWFGFALNTNRNATLIWLNPPVVKSSQAAQTLLVNCFAALSPWHFAITRVAVVSEDEIGPLPEFDNGPQTAGFDSSGKMGI